MSLQEHPLPPLTLVLGGARSGKSLYAESVLAGQPQPVYLATCQIYDDEMAERVRLHRTRRPAPWITVEVPLDLTAALKAEAKPGRAVLVDCLTLWVSNLMMAETDVTAAADALCAALPGLPCPVVFVANEVGLGIVPDNPLARAFRDHAGRLNQIVAARCQTVAFVAAGLPLILKDEK
ncbi:MAG TPA: bifunctional adenosylcobinamide kinase/adenosylcobinamide-phosphate guanylyltransferase [Candidatus Sulfotelmatobacter sp.]|jgi:adenosylcobinamide kinase/adenosylcobinamide-phosphate guanylyltransferase|nr:bifunctional adenosylcobinamide kinase/adenosylcobinamide-phosphate guanylyltransferase [Candidatus Sulfotelmatobacter sp.]